MARHRHQPRDVAGIAAATAPARARQVLAGGDTVFSTVQLYLEKVAFIDESIQDEYAPMI